MEMSITTERRTATKNKLHALRRQGLLPLVAYGPEIPSLSLQADRKAFEQLYHRAGHGALIDVTLPGERAPRKALIRAFDYNSKTREPLHAELFVVNLKEEITAEVPVRLVGESPVARAGTGVLIQVLDELRVRAMPGDLPAHIDVDVTDLTETGTPIHARDLQLPPGVTLLNDPDAVVVEVGTVRAAAEEAAAAPAAPPVAGASEA